MSAVLYFIRLLNQLFYLKKYSSTDPILVLSKMITSQKYAQTCCKIFLTSPGGRNQRIFDVQW